MTELPDLPAGGEWATEPLLDPANLGRYVVASWNGNRGTAERIHKITRTNVHAGDQHRPTSYRVAPAGNIAHGSSSGYSVSCQTYAWAASEPERRELASRLHRFQWHEVSAARLRSILALLDR